MDYERIKKAATVLRAMADQVRLIAKEFDSRDDLGTLILTELKWVEGDLKSVAEKISRYGEKKKDV